MIGESSAAYLWSRTAAANIAARVPDARIVMILRDPAERAFSQYLHQLSAGLTRARFRDHLRECERHTGGELGIYHPFLEAGLYSEQARRFLDRFPRRRIRIYWYEEAWREPDRLLADLFRFLEVDTAFHPDVSRRSLERRAPRFASPHYFLKKVSAWYPLRAMVPPGLRAPLRRLAFRRGEALRMDPADRRYLVDYYREDIAKLACLLNRDLSDWLREAI